VRGGRSSKSATSSAYRQERQADDLPINASAKKSHQMECIMNTKKQQHKNVAAIMTAIIYQFLLLLAVSYFNQNILMTFPIVVRMIAMFLCQWIFLLIPIFLMGKNGETLRDIGFLKENILLQVLVGILIATAMCLMLTVLPILFGQKEMVSSTRYTQTWQFVFQFFYTVFGVALAEEVFFRGYLFKKLLDAKASKPFAILVSSVVFGLFHMFAGGLIQVVVTAIIGVIYCLCREKIKHCTLLSLIIAHGIYDALIVLCASIM
jgi:membrane protease YdiL (CAAX protease family)